MSVIVNKIKIRELMSKKNIENFSQLANMLDISKTQLSNILSDKYRPIKSNIEDLAKFLEVNPTEIIKEKEDA